MLTRNITKIHHHEKAFRILEWKIRSHSPKWIEKNTIEGILISNNTIFIPYLGRGGIMSTLIKEENSTETFLFNRLTEFEIQRILNRDNSNKDNSLKILNSIRHTLIHNKSYILIIDKDMSKTWVTKTTLPRFYSYQKFLDLIDSLTKNYELT